MKTRTQPGTARTHILDVATKLFYQQGINATGIDLIIAQAGITKKTFYYHFPSKAALVTAYIQQRDRQWREMVQQRTVAHSSDPIDQALYLFDILAERFQAEDFRGCAFTNAIVETANMTHPVHLAAVEHKTFLRDFLHERFQQAGLANTEMLAQQWLLIMDGALVTAAREGNTTAATIARDIAITLIRK